MTQKKSKGTYAAAQRALETLLRGQERIVEYSRIQAKIDAILAYKATHGMKVDVLLASAFLGISDQRIRSLMRQPDPKHPFKVPKIEPVEKGQKTRPRGKPPMVASLRDVIAWSKDLVRGGHIKQSELFKPLLSEKFRVGTSLVDLPFSIKVDPVKAVTTITGVHLSHAALVDFILKSINHPLAITFMPLHKALAEYPWQDPGLRVALAETYTDHLRQEADLFFEQVRTRSDDELLSSRTPPASSQRTKEPIRA